MQLGDVLKKIANNSELTPQELDFITRSGNETQQRNSQVSEWVGFDNKANFKNATFSQANFAELPLSFFYFRSSTNQSISNSAFQIIDFDENLIISSPAYFSWSSATPSKIFINQTLASRGVVLYGQIQFASNSTGRRAVKVVSHLESGTEIDSLVAVQVSPVSTFPTIASFCVPFFVNKDTSYLTMQVLQTSGGALDMEAINIGIMLVK